MNIQPNIAEATDMLKEMLERCPIDFSGPTLNMPPDKGGIYVLFNKNTNEPLYAGRTRGGDLQSRLRAHWESNGSSDLVEKLAKECPLLKNKDERKSWIKKNVEVRWLTEDEFDMDIKFAEYFVIGVLRPPFNG